jgi:hypothetical protein
MNASTRSWAISGTLAETATARTNITTGNKSLSDPLDRIRIFIDGTATFDAGTINILLEGHNT